MNTILSTIAGIAIVVIIIFMPVFLAVILRLIFRRLNVKLLATLVAVPFALFFISRHDFSLDPRVVDRFSLAFRITLMMLKLVLTLILYFGIPYLMAIGGVRLSDKILTHAVRDEYERLKRKRE